MDLFDDFSVVPAHRPTWAEIKLENLLFNLEQIKKAVGPEARIMGVVKADAYGHGVDVAELLQDEGVPWLGVAFLDEAIALRQKGIDRCDLFILGYTGADQIPELVEWDVTPGVYQLEFAQALSDYCVVNGSVHPVHIKVDTGMGRIGFRASASRGFTPTLPLRMKATRTLRIYSSCATLRWSRRFPIRALRFRSSMWKTQPPSLILIKRFLTWCGRASFSTATTPQTR